MSPKPFVDAQRVRNLNDRPHSTGPVIYYMERDQRVHDNWALLYAQQIAFQTKSPLVVVCSTDTGANRANERQQGFMRAGLDELRANLATMNVPFLLTDRAPDKILPQLVPQLNAGLIVVDFSPLKPNRKWREKTAKSINIAVHEVDAHNIIPAWIASDKKEWAAYTFRPKVNRQLNEYLTDIPKLRKHPYSLSDGQTRMIDRYGEDHHSQPTESYLVAPGVSAANAAMKSFLNRRLARYADHRNDPNQGAQSNLSPYLHFGQLSAQRLALETQRYDDHIPSQESFLEELIVRRELSDNFCLYEPSYDSFDGFPEWSRGTLNAHRNNARQYVYSQKQFESADTHDHLWNAAQTELLTTGKMHGYLRMYWAKKILEWSVSPEEALSTALYLNDAYSLDGNDPNGFAGVAWSIGGVHDRAWSEREVFGKVRYMNLSGCKRKFDINAYMTRVMQTNLAEV